MFILCTKENYTGFVGLGGTEIFGIDKRDSFGSHGVVRHPLSPRLNQ